MNFKEAEFNTKLATVLMVFGGFISVFIPLIGAGFFVAALCLTISKQDTAMAHTFLASVVGLVCCIIITILTFIGA